MALSKDAVWRLGISVTSASVGNEIAAAINAGTATAGSHKAFLDLIHFISEGPATGFATGATKTVTGGAFPTQILWRRADTTKLVERNITWTGTQPTAEQWKLYDTDGVTVLSTVTDAVSYSGPFESGRVRTIS